MSEARQRAVARACESGDVRVEARVAGREPGGGRDCTGNGRGRRAGTCRRARRPRPWSARWGSRGRRGRWSPRRSSARAGKSSWSLRRPSALAWRRSASAGCGSGSSATSASAAASCCASCWRGRGCWAHFSGWAFSDEVGHYKPSPRIFEAALGALERRAGGGAARRRPAPHRRRRRRRPGDADRPLQGHERRGRRRPRPRGRVRPRQPPGAARCHRPTRSRLSACCCEPVELGRPRRVRPPARGPGGGPLHGLARPRLAGAVGREAASRNGRSWATGGWRSVDRESGDFLGRTGLKRWPQFEETELGWALQTGGARSRHRHRGRCRDARVGRLSASTCPT